MVPMGPMGAHGHPMGPHGPPWDPMGPYGAPMGPHGVPWGPLGLSYGWTLSLFGLSTGLDPHLSRADALVGMPQ